MRVKSLLIAVLAGALCASTARADIHSGAVAERSAADAVAPRVCSSADVPAAVTRLAQASDWAVSPPAFDETGVGVAGTVDGAVLPIAPGQTSSLDSNPVRQDARVLPPTPGSASLFLSAVLSIGAWNVVRCARNIHFTIPEWYHTGGPQQIGAAVALDLDFNELLPCSFSDDLSERPALRWHCREPQWRFKPRLRVVDADPRGPPLCA